MLEAGLLFGIFFDQKDNKLNKKKKKKFYIKEIKQNWLIRLKIFSFFPP